MDDVGYVPSEVRKCPVPPNPLRSEISFSRTCNIPKLISYIYRIAFFLLEMLHLLCVHVVVQVHVHWNKRLLSVKFS